MSWISWRVLSQTQIWVVGEIFQLLQALLITYDSYEQTKRISWNMECFVVRMMRRHMSKTVIYLTFIELYLVSKWRNSDNVAKFKCDWVRRKGEGDGCALLNNNEAVVEWPNRRRNSFVARNKRLMCLFVGLEWEYVTKQVGVKSREEQWTR